MGKTNFCIVTLLIEQLINSNVQKIEYIISRLIKKLHLRAIINSKIHKTSKICAGTQFVNSSMEKYSDIGYDCIILNTEVGAFCSLGANIVIGGAPHTIDWVSTSPVFNENRDHLTKKFSKHKFDLFKKTIIGNDVWIGNNVMIKSGVTVGDGAVIGMGSIVTKDVPPYEIWAGNPARLLKKRFSQEIINELININWWSLDDNEIEKYAKYFNNIEEFIKIYKLKKIQ